MWLSADVKALLKFLFFFFKDGRTAGEENDEASDGAFLTKNRKYYRRLFIFEPVEV